MSATLPPSLIVWFRNDLRLHDNSALYAAYEHHRKSSHQTSIVAVFFITTKQWQEHQLGSNKIRFLLRSVESLAKSLQEKNIPLYIETSHDFSNISQDLLAFCSQHNAKNVYWNDEYAWDEQLRDKNSQELLEKNHITCQRFHDDVLLPPGQVLTQQGKFFSVFTPFKRAMLKQLENLDISLKPAPRKLSSQTAPLINIEHQLRQHYTDWPCLIDENAWPAGESAAHKSLNIFIKKKVITYQEARDLPDIKGTSQISQHLSVGSLSIKQCLITALNTQTQSISNISNPGASTWISELIWREFYRHLLVGFPWISKHQPFKPEYSAIPWRYNENDFFAWQDGLTGYPIVDAAMRQLNSTGWMHNRLRMISAMFLSKHLLIDWRWGEAYFLQKLIDADFASNNGGWQWSASTGADAAPYFRIFNPYLQAKRFDTQGSFIANQLPELSVLNTASRIQPSIMEAQLQGYPRPIIDHNVARDRAKSVFSAALSNTKADTAN